MNTTMTTTAVTMRANILCAFFFSLQRTLVVADVFRWFSQTSVANFYVTLKRVSHKNRRSKGAKNEKPFYISGRELFIDWKIDFHFPHIEMFINQKCTHAPEIISSIIQSDVSNDIRL